MTKRSQIAWVLSGGGVRGAYEAGVAKGIMAILRDVYPEAKPFDLLTGSSVGAINAAFFAANASRMADAATELAEVWTQLDPNKHLRMRWGALSPMKWLRSPSMSLLDRDALAEHIISAINWTQLRHNIDYGVLSALVVTAFDVAGGHTAMFADLAPGTTFTPSRDPRRKGHFTTISASHVMASAAIPLLWPPVKLGQRLYYDGGIRFNTPLAPAIRCGADKLLVIPLLQSRESEELESGTLHLLGKLLNSILSDPVMYDLQVLHRFNRVVDNLQASLTADEWHRFAEQVATDRGVSYRKLETLVISPSQDIGCMAGEYIRAERPSRKVRTKEKWILRLLESRTEREADWASYMLLDGDFAKLLLDLGERDALAQEAQIIEFYRPT